MSVATLAGPGLALRRHVLQGAENPSARGRLIAIAAGDAEVADVRVELTVGQVRRSTFADLRSRWTTPWECASSRPAAT